MTKLPQAVLFDIGTVLVQLNFSKLLIPLGQSADQFQQWPPYDAFERGTIPASQFRNAVEELTGNKYPSADAFASWFCSILEGPVAGVPEMLQRLSSQTVLYGLSNTTEIHYHYLRNHYHWLSPLKNIYTSFQFGLRKPEPDIFIKTAQTIGLAPSEILFIDDNVANVEAARSIGMPAQTTTGDNVMTCQILRASGFTV